jgi:hypothetical protein
VLHGSYSKVCSGKHLSDTLLLQNGLEQEYALLLYLFNFALEYANRKVQENLVGLELNGTHHLLVYNDYVSLLGDNINTIKKNTKALTDTIKVAGLEVNTENTMSMLMFCH